MGNFQMRPYCGRELGELGQHSCLSMLEMGIQLTCIKDPALPLTSSDLRQVTQCLCLRFPIWIMALRCLSCEEKHEEDWEILRYYSNQGQETT